jgi:predicted O-methyltransferase YrrM
MSNYDIDQIDSLFIAKHILERLNLPFGNKQVTSLDKDVVKAVRAIEKIETSWEYITETDNHSFGRKEKGETIKLWSVPNKSAQVLRNLVILTGAKNVLEIGTSAGYSTLFLADGVKHNDGKVITIELLREKAALARNFFEQSDLDNITLIQDEAGKVLENWSYGEIDFVFLDADKENYGKYFDLLLPLMKENGLIVADNINDYGHMMENYLQRVTGTHLPRSRSDTRVMSYYLAALDNGLMITKKT